MVNSKLFRSKMILFDDTNESLAAALGISKVSLSAKINNTSEFRLSEIRLIIERYHLTLDEIEQIFFVGVVEHDECREVH